MNFIYLFKKQILVLFCFVFLFSILFISVLILIVSFCLLYMSLVCIFFPSSLMYKLKLFEIFFLFNVIIYSNNLSVSYCFFCLPLVLVNSVLVFSCLEIFFKFTFDFLSSSVCSRVLFLIFTYL